MVADEYMIIISSQKAYKDIRAELNEKGVNYDQMIRYVNKDLKYYQALDNRRKRQELEEIYEIFNSI